MRVRDKTNTVRGVLRKAAVKLHGAAEAVEEADAFETALDKSMKPQPLPKKPKDVSTPMDAFEAAFDMLPGNNDAGSQTESSDAGSDRGSAAQTECSDVGSGDGNDAGSDRIEASDDGAEEVPDNSGLPSQEAEHYSRAGNRFFWRGVHIGTLTQWKGNTSCVCVECTLDAGLQLPRYGGPTTC